MEDFKTEKFETEIYSEGLDCLYNEKSEDIEKVIFENRDLYHDLKLYWRYIKKNITFYSKKKKKKEFTNIVYLTLDCPPYTPNSSRIDSPLVYINEMRKQYPDNDIRVFMPLINISEGVNIGKKLKFDCNGNLILLEKTSVSFTFFAQNKKWKAFVYQFPKNEKNVNIYGIYSPAFSKIKNVAEFSKIQMLSPFVKASRIAIKKMIKENFIPDIIHSENIPFFLGCEFESYTSYPIKVMQVIKDMTLWDMAKAEAFWAGINLADEKSMQKICRDEEIKKCIIKLFDLHNTKRFYQMRDCLDFIYKNYYKFRKYVDKGDNVDENYFFNKLNSRIIKLFPQIAQDDKLYFNPMLSSIKYSDFWTTISKTYYQEIFKNLNLTNFLTKYIEKSKEKSDYIDFGNEVEKYPLENTRNIYNEFNQLNFRDERIKNKKLLIKEFSIDRIKTNFVDSTLFDDENVKLAGYLDSFYEAPLIFINTTLEIYSQGIDILFNTILKLFDLHKNIQVIFVIKDGLNNTYIRNLVDFLSKNKYLNGRWIFIDGKVSLTKFYSGSDMTLMPRRTNVFSPEHFVAMHYGCVPVVSNIGILNDTVVDIFDDIAKGCGFKTKTSFVNQEDSTEIFLTPVMKALTMYQNNPSSWNLLIKNCMKYDSSWNFKIIEKYQNIYKKLIA